MSIFLIGEVGGLLIYLKPRYYHQILTLLKQMVMRNSILNNMIKSFVVCLVMCMQFLFLKIFLP